MHAHDSLLSSAPWPNRPELRYLGPPPEAGPTPTVCFLALGVPLTLDRGPIALPAQRLAARGYRVFSIDLPSHEAGADPHQALQRWADQMEKGIDPLAPFLDHISTLLTSLHQEGLMTSLSMVGLSRGGLLAALLGARMREVQRILLFAPVIRLASHRHFQELTEPLASRYDLLAQVDSFADKEVALWIGNRDQCVHTELSYEWITAVTESQVRHEKRHLMAELSLRPSIGHQGHGTSEASFEQGIQWLIRT